MSLGNFSGNSQPKAAAIFSLRIASLIITVENKGEIISRYPNSGIRNDYIVASLLLANMNC
jgi:hypothetical protein